MDVSLVVLAVPVFIVSMLIEFFLSRKRQQVWFRLGDTMSNLACGLISQLTGLIFAVWTLVAYTFVYEHFRLFDLPRTHWTTWGLSLILADFIYYWWHRSSHVINIFWASHIVHHQSEEYNLSVALRQAAFGSLFSWLVYAPFGVLGIPIDIFFFGIAVNLVLGFFPHTRFTNRIPIVEYIVNTPSHHRVHHGTNRQYIDKNFGGVLIIWDRIFGTFEPENEPVRYGIVNPLNRLNPVWANLHYWHELYQNSKAMNRWSDRLIVWIASPGWRPGDKSREDILQRLPMDATKRTAYFGPKPTKLSLLLFSIGIALTLFVMVLGKSLAGPALVLVSVFAVACFAIAVGD